MKLTPLAATAALLAGCAVDAPGWRAETVPVILERVQPALLFCPPLDPAIEAEATRVTPINAARGDLDAATAALLGSEARKNARLREIAAAYRSCRSFK
jgi:hypothetical protein